MFPEHRPLGFLFPCSPLGSTARFKQPRSATGLFGRLSTLSGSKRTTCVWYDVKAAAANSHACSSRYFAFLIRKPHRRGELRMLLRVFDDKALLGKAAASQAAAAIRSAIA